MVSTTEQLSRERILARLEQDLIGPGAADELLDELPTDRYLTGILYPRHSSIEAEEDEELRGAPGGGPDDGDGGEGDGSVRLSAQMKPSTMGLSFSATATQGTTCADITISLATYEPLHASKDGHLEPGPATRIHDTRWRRHPWQIDLADQTLSPGYRKLELPENAPDGLEVHYQAQLEGEHVMVTLAVVNNSPQGESRADREAACFFQTGFSVSGARGSQVVPRPFRTRRSDEEGRLSALLYRNVHTHCVGHTCSGACSTIDGTSTVTTAWIPRARVPAMSTRGAEEFRPLTADQDVRPLSAEWLAHASPAELGAGLQRIHACYESWIAAQRDRIPSLPEELKRTAEHQLATCEGALQRIGSAIGRLSDKDAPDLRECFQLANRAILLARKWSRGEDDLVWRPFQMAFILLALESTADAAHEDREVMDLLWFPTGGGKTEAYLGLIAFLLFHRRLRHERPDDGAGTAAIMRYTLRALTIQQFQRAAGLTMACEQLRRESGDARFGQTPFSIGLWVGGGATPNTVKDAASLTDTSNCTHKQLTTCPVCNKRIKWSPNGDLTEMAARCYNAECLFGRNGNLLPVYTIDEDVYRVLPSLLIGTVDKFAQIARNERTGRLFGVGTRHSPPDLIVQDELHLISGPLGTIAGLYETAIDHLCSNQGRRPKVLGSTATIRRAEAQIRSLFDRRTCQFPPPGLDHDNSGFAVVDKDAPGRLYVGITTSGRSPKFTLQAVSASLLQSATSPDVPAKDQASYSTLLVYFNSLRELGGALVLMQDDVHATISAFSKRRGETGRTIGVPEELTSRKSAAEIRDLLQQLESEKKSPEVLLASNMISVGVDIQRLALMVVNGQPKTIAEYIQATSRVGRGSTPGLVISVYNSSRTRDRSHYETFSSWHDGIYRDVEATSVTPFASRAVEKAIHAAFVSIVRHMIPSMRSQPRLSAEARDEAVNLRDVILDRVRTIDAHEEPKVRAAIDGLIQAWLNRDDVDEYWVDHGKKVGLMISAEQYAAKRASGAAIDSAWPTPNSMRDVEPTTLFRLGFPTTTQPQDG